MGDGIKSGLEKTNTDVLKGRGKVSKIDFNLSHKRKQEIYNSVTVSKSDKDTVQIFKVQVNENTWYAMKDYECDSMELKRVPKQLLATIGHNLHTKSFNLNKDNVNDMEVLKRMQLSAVSSR